ncbi:uncharacterized protein PGTG_09464 [Puccinia graminis f. sp. tritici CRL 75-36-700-3]|uniref:Uncharacterized protein n=1 Tax=Puccinia graminis f. sp. tritici (strain CRL 75-36-700-3 / race SCCL) TaxID=418459 RepID=E3KHH6_PUCGT|nr:uncharacterized protein PGTG_09464 [Puccinia graminis f. sp. tritici CRL 75-36-700-3]EFP83751.1 hypothetical protein PGTG_09464 [Puccinia graminis f. sp. tritici CRL 75-36-700-3]
MSSSYPYSEYPFPCSQDPNCHHQPTGLPDYARGIIGVFVSLFGIAMIFSIWKRSRRSSASNGPIDKEANVGAKRNDHDERERENSSDSDSSSNAEINNDNHTSGHEIATPHTPGDGCNDGNSSAGGGWFRGISWFGEGGRAGGDSTDGGDRTGSHGVERAGNDSFGGGGGGGASSDD